MSEPGTDISPEHARIMDLWGIKRDQLRDLLEADQGADSSKQAEAIADEMIARMKAGNEEIDTSAYGPEVALFVHDEQKSVAEQRAARAESKRRRQESERAKQELLHAKTEALRAEEHQETAFQTSKQRAGIWNRDELMKGIDEAAKRKQEAKAEALNREARELIGDQETQVSYNFSLAQAQRVAERWLRRLTGQE